MKKKSIIIATLTLLVGGSIFYFTRRKKKKKKKVVEETPKPQVDQDLGEGDKIITAFVRTLNEGNSKNRDDFYENFIHTLIYHIGVDDKELEDAPIDPDGLEEYIKTRSEDLYCLYKEFIRKIYA